MLNLIQHLIKEIPHQVRDDVEGVRDDVKDVSPRHSGLDPESPKGWKT